MPTLVMMHGMTGTAEMMRPFAESILPEGWNLIIPEATFPHPRRGFSWWRWIERENDPKRWYLTANELADVDSSLLKLKEQLPDDRLVFGGFSQGGAMAQELLQLDFDVMGIIVIGTRAVRPLELRQRLIEIPKSSILWMHGEKDAKVPLDAGKEVVELFEEANWKVTRIQHTKGHMIPTKFHEIVRHWLITLN